MNNTNLAFIGAGNMSRSLIGGLIKNGYPSRAITVADINSDMLSAIEKDFSVSTNIDNNAAIEHANVIVLAVKPTIIKPVIKQIKQSIAEHMPLIISIAAGVREKDITRWIGHRPPVVRCMPNTPALLGAGASGLFANRQVSATQKQLAQTIIESTGIAHWVEDESQLDTITALSGSGPAYFFYLTECMTDAAVKLGLDKELAETLANQTAFGAARMLVETSTAAKPLRENVTSIGGTTEAAINSFESNELRNLVYEGMESAYNRSIELGKKLGEE